MDVKGSLEFVVLILMCVCVQTEPLTHCELHLTQSFDGSSKQLMCDRLNDWLTLADGCRERGKVEEESSEAERGNIYSHCVNGKNTLAGCARAPPAHILLFSTVYVQIVSEPHLNQRLVLFMNVHAEHTRSACCCWSSLNPVKWTRVTWR